MFCPLWYVAPWLLSGISTLSLPLLPVFNSSLRALPIIYDILFLVRPSWITCSYGNSIFQTEGSNFQTISSNMQ